MLQFIELRTFNCFQDIRLKSIPYLFPASQVSDLHFYVSDTLEGLSSDNALFYHRPGRQSGDQPEEFFRAQPMTGRYVKITRYQQETNYLCFLELEVYQATGTSTGMILLSWWQISIPQTLSVMVRQYNQTY